MKFMNQAKKYGSKVLVVGAALASTTSANAALTIPDISVGDTELVASAVIAGFAIIWAIKRAISFVRS